MGKRLEGFGIVDEANGFGLELAEKIVNGYKWQIEVHPSKQ